MYLSGIEPHADDAVLADVKARLGAAPELAGSDIEASCANGVVTLRGSVHSSAVRDLAEQVAFEVRGVFDVLNRLRVVPGAIPEPPPEPPPEAPSESAVAEAVSVDDIGDREPPSEPAPEVLERDDEPPTSLQ